MDNSDDNSARQQTSLFSKVLKVAAYPIAAVSGFWAASVSVHNSAYEMAKRLGGFDDLLAKHTPKSKADMHDLVTHRITPAEYAIRSAESKAKWLADGNKRMDALGLNTFSKKWNYMSVAGKENALLAGMTVAGIAIGAVLSIADSKDLIDDIRERKQQQER